MDITDSGPEGEVGEVVFPHESVDCMVRWPTGGLVIYFRGGSRHRIKDKKLADVAFSDYQNWLKHR